MKISKLFHWLYAFLMFLPVFALLPSTLYFAFNEHASNYTDQTITETYQYQTNEVNSINDLVVGNIYYFDTSGFSIADGTTLFSVSFLKFNDEVYIKNNINILYYSFGYNIDFSYGSFFIGNFPSFYFVYQSNANSSIDFNYINSSDYLGEITTTINENEINPLSVFDNAVNAVVEFPLFSWASVSFLVTPFSYICNLFGVPATSPIITMLSYWLTISIIWLVFDLIMYVPLLVHRWIDKGIVE